MEKVWFLCTQSLITRKKQEIFLPEGQAIKNSRICSLLKFWFWFNGIIVVAFWSLRLLSVKMERRNQSRTQTHVEFKNLKIKLFFNFTFDSISIFATLFCKYFGRYIVNKVSVFSVFYINEFQKAEKALKMSQSSFDVCLYNLS